MTRYPINSARSAAVNGGCARAILLLAAMPTVIDSNTGAGNMEAPVNGAGRSGAKPPVNAVRVAKFNAISGSVPISASPTICVSTKRAPKKFSAARVNGYCPVASRRA